MDSYSEAAGERFREGLGIELRIVARFRDGTDVHQLFDVVCVQETDELFDRPRGMTDGEDCLGIFRGIVAHMTRIHLTGPGGG
jgi:hypothetical protein